MHPGSSSVVHLRPPLALLEIISDYKSVRQNSGQRQQIGRRRQGEGPRLQTSKHEVSASGDDLHPLSDVKVRPIQQCSSRVGVIGVIAPRSVGCQADNVDASTSVASSTLYCRGDATFLAEPFVDGEEQPESVCGACEV